jgi:hypothetical protein
MSCYDIHMGSAFGVGDELRRPKMDLALFKDTVRICGPIRWVTVTDKDATYLV